jgi:hypothetical protein
LQKYLREEVPFRVLFNEGCEAIVFRLRIPEVFSDEPNLLSGARGTEFA